MRLLLDTHILIWFLEGNILLSNSRRRLIAQAENEIFVSIASLWKMAIKISLGKLALSRSLADFINQLATENIEILPALPPQVLAVSVLPFHHRDPFDRIIISQSSVENLVAITDDPIFADYGISLA